MGVRPVGVERQLAHLLECRLADLLAVAVADVDGEQAGERVEVALAVRVPEVAAVALDDDRHVLVLAEPAHAGEVHPQVVAGVLLEIGGGHCSAFRVGTMRSGLVDRCTSLRTTDPSRAPVIGRSPTVPTTISWAPTGGTRSRTAGPGGPSRTTAAALAGRVLEVLAVERPGEPVEARDPQVGQEHRRNLGTSGASRRRPARLCGVDADDRHLGEKPRRWRRRRRTTGRSGRRTGTGRRTPTLARDGASRRGRPSALLAASGR